MYTDAYISIKSFFEKIGRDRIYTYSATSAFFIILSFFPFAILLLTLIQYTPLSEGYLIERLEYIFPEAIYPFISEIISEIYEGTRGTSWILVSGLGALWSSSKGVMSLIRGVNVCFNIDDRRNYFIVRLLSMLYTFILIIVLIFVMVTLVFGTSIYNYIKPYIGEFNKFIQFFLRNRVLIALFLLTVMFMIVYKFLPAKQNKFFRMFPGAALAAGGTIGLSYLLSIYVRFSPNFTLTYGSLTSLILVMLWLYFSMYIVFICGEINFFMNILFDNMRAKRLRNKALRYEKKMETRQLRHEKREQTMRLHRKNHNETDDE